MCYKLEFKNIFKDLKTICPFRFRYVFSRGPPVHIYLNSVNLQFNMVGRRDDDMIVPPFDGPMFILIDWV